MKEKYGWEFRTKHELMVELVTWLVNTLRGLRFLCAIWFVADGAYAASPVLKPLLKSGVVVFSRLRRDAKLFDLPGTPKVGQRGRRPIYGVNRISLAKRAANKHGWDTIAYHCRGVEVPRQYKTFLATSELVRVSSAS